MTQRSGRACMSRRLENDICAHQQCPPLDPTGTPFGPHGILQGRAIEKQRPSPSHRRHGRPQVARLRRSENQRGRRKEKTPSETKVRVAKNTANRWPHVPKVFLSTATPSGKAAVTFSWKMNMLCQSQLQSFTFTPTFIFFIFFISTQQTKQLTLKPE